MGWFTLNSFLFVSAFFTKREHHPNPPFPHEWLTGLAVIAVYYAAFVFVTWLVAFLPLYALVPRRSVLWRWPVCTLCGAAAGALVMAGFYGFNFRESGSAATTILASMVGGVTCLFAALTADRFHDAPTATSAGRRSVSTHLASDASGIP